MTERGQVSGAGVSLHFRAWGPPAAPTVVLLHGLSGFSFDWEQLGPKLAATHRVIALDMRGFGESGLAAGGAYALSDFSADLDALAAALLLDRFSLIGHSLGGRVALYYAATRPQTVSALILLDAVPEMHPDGSRTVRERLATAPASYPSRDAAVAALSPPFRQQSAEFVEERFAQYLRVAGDGSASIKRDPSFSASMPGRYVAPAYESDRTFWSLSADVRAPALLVRGTRSTMVTPELAQRLRAEMPALEVVEIDASHNLPADQPDALAAILRGFLAKQRSHAFRP